MFVRDFFGFGFVYILMDLGGEIGVLYEIYFLMFVVVVDKFWYLYFLGLIYFIVMFIEYNWI